MVARLGNVDRHVVPRWRSVRRTIQAGEFQRLGESRPLSSTHIEELSKLEKRWQAERWPLSGIELSGSLAVAGERDRAHEVAAAVARSGNEIAAIISGHLAREAHKTGEPAALHNDPTWLHTKVARAKARTLTDCRNPIAWSDLARRYTALGQLVQAERALRTARLLAPNSRYLLRAAARLYLHVGSPEHAASILRSSPRTESDPWLMSALLAVEGSMGRRTSGLRVPRRILEDANFREIERADLASEMATIELHSGAERRSRKLFERSLHAPTDNSLAQAGWASQHLLSLDLSLDDVDIPFTSEARAKNAAQAENWQTAVQHGLEWIDDQPFDTDAATFCSYAASVGLEDWATAESVARIGLRARPGDPMLVNNLAFALIEMDRVSEAALILRRPDVVAERERGHIALLATTGLLLFREGDNVAGRASYERAISTARKQKHRSIAAVASSMLLREELQRDNADVGTLLNSTRDLAAHATGPGARRQVEKSFAFARSRGYDV